MASLFMLEDTTDEKILILEREIKKLKEGQGLQKDIDDLRSIVGQITECACQCESCRNYE